MPARISAPVGRGGGEQGGGSQASTCSVYGGRDSIRILVLKINYWCGDEGHPVKEVHTSWLLGSTGLCTSLKVGVASDREGRTREQGIIWSCAEFMHV